MSIQGESTFQGLPCVFVRLTGCNLRCSYCDTKYAYEGGATSNGNEMSIDEIVNAVLYLPQRRKVRKATTAEVSETAERKENKSLCSLRLCGEYLVEITGGEPLLQEEVYELSEKLSNEGYKVLVDTNGSISVDKLDPRVIRIIDIKCPGSGMADQMYWDNLKKLRPTDEIKFVLSDKRDYEWAKDVIKKYSLFDNVKVVLFSPAFGPAPISEAGRSKISPAVLAECILHDNLPVRLQIQLHKYIGVR